MIFNSSDMEINYYFLFIFIFILSRKKREQIKELKNKRMKPFQNR